MEKTCAPESGTSSEENASGAAHRQGGEIMNHTECQFKWLMSQPDRGYLETMILMILIPRNEFSLI